MKFFKLSLAAIGIFLILTNISFKNMPSEHASKPLTYPGHLDSIRSALHRYIWPTDASKKITSSFAEYRTSHFHSGIDLSTNGQKGYKVFAVSDGFLYRVRIQANGYGKMVFIKHLDGLYSTYAHLDNFNDEINSMVRKEQYRRGTYQIDCILDSMKIPVKQGDVIAYTGESGFGPPHLHFELRDENLDPINPLIGSSYLVTDDVRPRITRFMIKPLSPGTTVDGGAETKYLSRFSGSSKQKYIPQTIRLHGQAGFGIDVIDRSTESWTKSGIHNIELYIDDSLAYSMKLNHLIADETKQIDLHYDLNSILTGRGKFQKLYIDQGNSLPFYGNKPSGTGVIRTDQLSEGKHIYRVICSDIQGNETMLHGSFFANHQPVFSISSADNQRTILMVDNPELMSKYYIYGKRSYQSDWSIHTFAQGKYDAAGDEIILPINTKPYDVIKVVAESKAGSVSLPVYRFLKKTDGPVRQIYIDSKVKEDYIECIITTPGVFTEIPLLFAMEGSVRKDIPLEALDLNKYVGYYIPGFTHPGNRTIKVTAEVNGRSATASSDINVYPVPPDKPGSFTIEDAMIRVSYDSGAVYKPLFLTADINRSEKSKFVTLGPDNVLLNRGIRVSVPVTYDDMNNSNGLYFRTTQGWIFQTSKADSSLLAFSATATRLLGDFALMRDETPPSFGRVRIQPKNHSVWVSFRYYDNLSGIDPDEIKIYIDDKLVIPEIDGEHRRVVYPAAEQLASGKHKIVIRMKDRMNNESEYSRKFVVR